MRKITFKTPSNQHHSADFEKLSGPVEKAGFFCIHVKNMPGCTFEEMLDKCS